MNRTYAVIQNIARRRILYLIALDGNRTALRLCQACDRLDKLLLAVAVDTCDSQDLAGTHIQRQAVYLCDPARVAHQKVIDAENDIARLCFFLLDMQRYLPADHHGCQILLAYLGDVDSIDILTATNDRAVIRGFFDFSQLMRNNDNRLTVVGQTVHDCYQLLNLLRR